MTATQLTRPKHPKILNVERRGSPTLDRSRIRVTNMPKEFERSYNAPVSLQYHD
jgi:hypothetical protein